jgi:type I restriction enzyme, R subunit
MVPGSPNFSFLAEYDPRLVVTASRAERALSFGDPVGALTHLRTFAELLARGALTELGAYVEPRQEQAERLRVLKSRSVDEQVLAMFHSVRKTGNDAVHDGVGTQGHAVQHLKIARELAVWFYRTVRRAPGFKPGPFVPPANLEGETEELRRQVQDLQTEAEAREEERDEAQAAVERERLARLGAEEAAKKAAEEREIYEALAAEQEAERLKDSGALKAAQARLAEVESRAEQEESERQATARTFSPAQQTEHVQAANRAAANIDLDEAATRELIDEQLRAAGWEASTPELRYGKGVRPQKGRNLAIAEWPTKNGPADYVLFAGLVAIGVVEAKRKSKDVVASLEQAKRYSQGFAAENGVELAGGPWDGYQVPFLFATNGRPYFEQLQTKSGIWALDARRKTNRAGPLPGWATPEGLRQKLKQDIDQANAKLDQEATDYLGLRDYQVRAIRAVEAAIQNEQDKILVAMATGTGKTRTAIGLVYRLLKSGRFRRVLFLVDRSSLGEQTTDAFNEVDIEDLMTFGQIFGIDSVWLDKKTKGEGGVAIRVTIATVQSMVRRIWDDGASATTAQVDDYDCIIVDEAHRGYGLDQELSESELALADYGIRDQRDYISRYRRVLDHFDAVKIALTATPAKHTAQIFGRPVYRYTYREAVIDGHLIDHEPPINLVTRLAENGIHFDKGQQVPLFDPGTVSLDLVLMDDEVNLEVESFNKKVLSKAFNQVVCEALAEYIDPTLPEKTLVFAATDFHADQVVEHLKDAFEKHYGSVEDGVVVKITGTADRPLELIRRYKNEQKPKVAVTVDLLTTGIDVPAICNLVFLRRVKSRVLYEQMIGRATRQCPDIDKETFRIFDAVGLYDALEAVTEMKPVVADPNITFRQLLDQLERAIQEVQDPAARAHLVDELIGKLQRKKRRLKGEALDYFETAAGAEPSDLAKSLKQLTPEGVLQFFKDHPGVLLALERGGPAQPLLVSDSADEMVKVYRGYGSAKKPGDYLDEFSAYIRENLNQIPALQAVVQRPRDLTRKALKELALVLSEHGYTEMNLRSAWSEAKNEDIAARIVGFIRQAALGDPLVAYDERVERAVRKIKSQHAFTTVQKKWLDRIEKALKSDVVVDREALDRGKFAADGGFERFNKVFDGKLESLLGDLRESIWEGEAG